MSKRAIYIGYPGYDWYRFFVTSDELNDKQIKRILKLFPYTLSELYVSDSVSLRRIIFTGKEYILS